MKRILFSLFFAFCVVSTFAQSADVMNQVNKIGSVVRLIDEKYVDKQDLNKVSEDAITNILKALDPHSKYISPKDVEMMNEGLKGSFDGVGLSYVKIDDTIVVASLIEGGPAEMEGLRCGDKLIKVDGVAVTGDTIDNDFIKNHLRGKRGSMVNVMVCRDSDKFCEFSLRRDEIKIHSVLTYFMLDSKKGYVMLSQFSSNSYQEMTDAIKSLQKQGCEELVLDLRGNGGGYLNTAVDICSLFIPKGSTVVYTEGVHSKKTIYPTKRKPVFKGKLTILIDENSASASEITAGTMQDYDRATIIGRRSFGKGLVQTCFDLKDGSQIRLTTARYYTPSGRSIQRPYDKGTDDYNKEYQRRLTSGEFFHADSLHFPDSLKFLTINEKRTVYGGGGIVPDIFFPADTSENSHLLRNLVKNQLITYTAVDYFARNYNSLKEKYPNVDTFRSDFVVDSTFIKNLKINAEKNKIVWNEEEFRQSRRLIKNQFVALLVRCLFCDHDYYETILANDKLLKFIK